MYLEKKVKYCLKAELFIQLAIRQWGKLGPWVITPQHLHVNPKGSPAGSIQQEAGRGLQWHPPVFKCSYLHCTSKLALGNNQQLLGNYCGGRFSLTEICHLLPVPTLQSEARWAFSLLWAGAGCWARLLCHFTFRAAIPSQVCLCSSQTGSSNYFLSHLTKLACIKKR